MQSDQDKGNVPKKDLKAGSAQKYRRRRQGDDEGLQTAQANEALAKAALAEAAATTASLASPRLQSPVADPETVSFGGSDVEADNPLRSGNNPYVVSFKPPTPELGGNSVDWPWDDSAALPPTPEMQRIRRGIPSSELQVRLQGAEEKAASLEQKVAVLEEDLQLEKLSNEQLRNNRDNFSRDQESEQTELRADLESSAREERFQRERAAKFEEQVKELEEELHLEQLSSKTMQQERDRLTDQVGELIEKVSTSEQLLIASQAELMALRDMRGKLEFQVAAQTDLARTQSQEVEKKSLEMDQLRTEVAQLTAELDSERERATSLQDSLEQLRAEREVMDSEHALQIQQAHLQQEQLMQQLREFDQIRRERGQLQSKLGHDQGEAFGAGQFSVPLESEAKRMSIKDEIEGSIDLLFSARSRALGGGGGCGGGGGGGAGGGGGGEGSSGDQVQWLEEEKQQLQQRLDEMSQELQDVLAEKERLAAEIIEKARHIESLEAQVQELQDKAKDKLVKNVARTLRQKMEERHSVQEDHESKQVIANLQRELDITAREKERALENLEKAESQGKRTTATLVAKQDEIDELRRNNSRLVGDLAIQSNQAQKAQESLKTMKALSEDNAKLEAEHAVMTERVRSLEEQLAVARTKNEQLACEHAVFKEKCNALEENKQSNHMAVQGNAALAERAKLLEDQLRSTTEAKDTANKEVAVTSLKLEQFQEKFAAKENELSELRKELEKKIEAKQDELNDLREDLEEEVEEARDAAQARVDELQEAYDASQASLEEVQASLEELQVAADVAQASLAEANERWEAHLAEVRLAEEKLQTTEASTAATDGEQSKDAEEVQGHDDKDSEGSDEKVSRGNDEKEEKAGCYLPPSTKFAPLVAVYDHLDAEMGLRRIVRIQVPGRHMYGDGQSSVSGTVQPLANGVLVSLSKLPDAPHDAKVVQPYFLIDQVGTWEWKYEPLDGPWGFCESWGLAHGVLALVLQRLKDGEACALSEEKRVQRVRVKRSSSLLKSSTSRSEKLGRESIDVLPQKTPRSSLTADEGEKVKRRSSHKTKRGSEIKESATLRASSLSALDPGLSNQFQSLYAVVAAQLPAGKSVRMQLPPEMGFLSKSGHILNAGSLSIGSFLRGPYGLVKVSAVSQVHAEGRSAMRLYLGLHALSVLPDQQLLAGCISKDDSAALQWEVVEAQDLLVNCHELSLHAPGGVEGSSVLTAVKRTVVQEQPGLSRLLVQVELTPQSSAPGLERCGLFVALHSAMPTAIHPAMAKSSSASSILNRRVSNPNTRGPKALSASAGISSTVPKAIRAAPAAARRRSASQSTPQGRGLGAAAVLAEQLALQDADPGKVRR